MNNIVELKSINKSFGNKVIFNNLNLGIKEGEMVAIMGHSGAGKSTLLNIIGLLEAPDAGEVRIDGEIITNIHSHKALLLLRDTLGYVFQNFALVDTDKVWNALDVALEYVHASKREKEGRKVNALEKVDLLSKKENKIYELSGGEQQRVAIARLMLKPCKIILADEPTGSVDEETGDKIMELFKELNATGKTIVVVTHNPRIAKTCNYVINI